MNALEREIHGKIKSYGDLDFPGGMIRAFHKGQKIVDIPYGKVWKIYDLASLTKVIFTTSIVMVHVEQGGLALRQTVAKGLPWFQNSDVTLRQLLNHSAGNIDWKPFYKKIDRDLPVSLRWQQLYRQLRTCATGDGSKAVYSDIDFFLIAALLEGHFEKPLRSQWNRFKHFAMPKSQLHFCVNNKPVFSRKFYAPTEECPWRGKSLQGEVHDDNCWSLGGVSTHAGLFGSMNDVSDWVLAIRDIEMGRRGFVSSKTLRQFTKASMPRNKGDWGLGFMKPSIPSTAGQYFSQESYGHTGFTGTSIWMDPKKDLQVVLLSNRVCPSRKNKDFQKLRPKIHDWICESL